MPTPFPVGPINVFLIEGDELTLIDTGAIDPKAYEVLNAELSARGYTFKDIRRVIVTHAHIDHFGYAAQIVKASGGKVISHSRNRWWLTDFEHEWVRRHDFYHDVFLRGGAPRELADRVIAGMRKFTQYANSVPADQFVPVEDGDPIQIGTDAWRVVFAPGHASGLICLYEPDSRTLISSDHLLRDITSNPVLEPPPRGETDRPRALLDYLASMEKTAQLDIRIALPAHGDPIFDVRALVDARLAFHRSRLNHIEQQLECCAETTWEICNLIFPELKAFDAFLGMSEIVGHLDILEAEGRVRRDDSGDLVRYIPTRK